MLRYSLGFIGLLVVLGGCAKSDGCSKDTLLDCTCPSGLAGKISCEDGKLSECECFERADGICVDSAECDDGAFCNGLERCDPDHEDADEHGCLPASQTPFCDDGIRCTIDTCSNELNRCVFQAPDRDEDGRRDGKCKDAQGDALGDDCDDDDAGRFPGNYEACDKRDVDEDCDPTTFGDRDQDGDGAIDDKCCNGDNCGDDCNDKSIAERPLQPEFCDEVDNDCNGKVDDKAADVPWYLDEDGDGFGDQNSDDVIESCIPIPERSLLATDCSDDLSDRHPAQLEVCDLRDNNCDGRADEGPNCDVPEGYPVDPHTGTAFGIPWSNSGSGGSDGGSGGSDNGSGGRGPDPGPNPDPILCGDRDVSDALTVTELSAGDNSWSGTILLDGSILVEGEQTLTIAAGTEIYAEPGASLTIGDNETGLIVAEGTQARPIVLCGTEAKPGHWGGVSFAYSHSESRLKWVLVSDAGELGYGLSVTSEAEMTDISVTNSSALGVVASTFGRTSARFTVTGNEKTADLTSSDAMNHLPPNSVWTGNGEDLLRYGSGLPWSGTVRVQATNVPYLFTQDVSWQGHVTVDAGAALYMDADVALTLNGTVHFNGTEDSPIIIEGRAPQSGYWQGLYIIGDDVDLKHVQLRHGGAGDYPVVDATTRVLLQEVTIEDSDYIGLRLRNVGMDSTSSGIAVSNIQGVPLYLEDFAAIVDIPGDTVIENNANEYIYVRYGVLNRSGTIFNHDVPYFAPRQSGNHSISSAAHVVVEPGVHLRTGNQFIVDAGAWLTMEGTEEEPIVVEGDHEQEGDWYGFVLEADASQASSFQHVQFSEMGAGAYGGAINVLFSASLSADFITDCTFDSSSNYGIYFVTDPGADFLIGNTFTGIAPDNRVHIQSP